MSSWFSPRTCTGTRVSPRLTSLLFLLDEELYRQPRAVYKYWAGGLRSCYHSATSSSSSSSSTLFRSSTKCWTFLLCFSDVYIRIATVQVRGALRSPVMDVPVITQLMFLQYFEDVEVPQIPSSTECYRFQLYYRVVYVQCKLCKHRRCHSAVLGQVVYAPVVMLRQLLRVGQCRKLWSFRSRSWIGSLPVVVQRQVPDGRDSAENCGVSAVGAALGQGC